MSLAQPVSRPGQLRHWPHSCAAPGLTLFPRMVRWSMDTGGLPFTVNLMFFMCTFIDMSTPRHRKQPLPAAEFHEFSALSLKSSPQACGGGAPTGTGHIRTRELPSLSAGETQVAKKITPIIIPISSLNTTRNLPPRQHCHHGIPLASAPVIVPWERKR